MIEKPSVDYEVLEYSDQYKFQTLSLLKLLWTSLSDEQANDYFCWRYENNPYSKTPLIVIAVHKSHVVGVLGHMVQRFTINGKEENACVPVDGIVLQDYRRYGVYSRMLYEGVRLIDSLMEVYDFKMYFNASSNVRSAVGLLNLGWKLLGPKMYMTRISLKNLLINRLYASNQNYSITKFKKNRSIYTMEVTNEIRYEDLEHVISKTSSPVCVAHERVFFEWKYSRKKDNFQFVYLYKDSFIVGYMIIRKGSKYQYSLEEYGYTDIASFGLMISRLVKCMKIIIFRLFYLHHSKEEMRILSKVGFIIERLWVLKLFKKSRSSIYFRHINENTSASDYFINGINTLDVSNWKLFHTDIL